MSTLTNQDEVNKALIKIGTIKFEGLNQQGLVLAVVKAMRNNKTNKLAMKLLEGEENVDQIKFAKLVWNIASTDVRDCFLTRNNDWFMALVSDPEMTPIIAAAFKKHEGATTGGGDAKKYMEIVKRVEQLKIKQTEADDPFNPQLTAKERSAITKFDEKEKENKEGEAREIHNPNESAVTYCFLLGRLILYSGVQMKLSAEALVAVVDDMLRYYSVHGQKTVTFFGQVFGAQTNIIGPKSRIDIKPLITSLINHDNYVTAADKSENNKFLPNHKLSLKRIIRLVYICSSYKTSWGIMNAKEEFVVSIKQLFTLETSVAAPDMNSLAIIWYMCIGRENINAVMVDHWEKSASNELARILGKKEQGILDAPKHVFPLDKSTNGNFDLSE